MNESQKATAEYDEKSILAMVGVDALGERIYRALLQEGGGAADQLATRFGITRAEAIARLDDLRASGLIAQQSGIDGQYVPVDPRFSLRLLTDRHSESIARILERVPALAEQFDNGRSGTKRAWQTQLIDDPASIAGWYVRLQHQAGREFMAFDRPPYVSSATNLVEPVALDRGVVWRAIYAVESFEWEGAWQQVADLAARGEQARVASHLPIKLAIADRSIALLSLTHEDGTSDSMVTESSPLVDALCELFEFRWERAFPVPADESALAMSGVEPAPARPARSATREEQAVLSLIAAGMTDETIARQLGISSRTLRRRTQDLLIELKAENRFQAGAEAARRGWI